MYYMLKKESVAKRKDPKVRAKSRSNRIWQELAVSEGSLWQTKNLTTEVLKSLSRSPCKDSIPVKPYFITLCSYEHEGAILQCGIEIVIPLQPSEYLIFKAIRNPLERIKIYFDAAWLRDILELRTEDPVIIEVYSLPKSPVHKHALSSNNMKYATLPINLSNSSLNSTGSSGGSAGRIHDYLCAVIRYVGEIPAAHGTWFGVELVEDDVGRGLAAGSIRNKRLFSCPVDCAFFVPPNRIRSRRPDDLAARLTVAKISPHRREMADSPLEIDERVVWLSDNGPEAGVVKWLGYLMDPRTKNTRYDDKGEVHRELTAGVEFDRPVGTGNGIYHDRRLFHAKLKHASLLPLIGLIRETEFLVDNTSDNFDYIDGECNNGICEIEVHKNQHNHQRSSHATENAVARRHLPFEQISTEKDASRVQRLSQAANTKTIKRSNQAEYRPVKQELQVKNYANSRTTNYSSKTLPSKRNGLHTFELNTMVEITDHTADHCKYGIIRWIGELVNHSHPMAGLEMEEESTRFTDGSYGDRRIFKAPPYRALFVSLMRLKRDARFLEDCVDGGIGKDKRRESQGFGSIPCPEVKGHIAPPTSVSDLKPYVGQYKGIQGHHNSCYLDTMLYSMFSFSLAFDSILYRQRRDDDIDEYDTVQCVLRDCIVNPLRQNHFVRADKIMKLRRLLDKLGKVQGLTTDEKDPEEFLSSLLEQIMKADSFIKLNSGQKSYFYTLFLEKSDHVIMPTTQQLLSLSFLQSKVRLLEVPPCLILQMPVGSDYRMYKRIIPSLVLDVTDILHDSPRECSVCEDLATRECLQCYTNHSSDLRQTAYCDSCCNKTHAKRDNSHHEPSTLHINENYINFIRNKDAAGEPRQPVRINRELMELFAIVCIRASHYTTFVRCPTHVQGEQSNYRWLYFDSMSDRIGGPDGYNVPEVCADDGTLNAWLTPDPASNPPTYSRVSSVVNDSSLPDFVRRCICDTYFCMYQNASVLKYS